MFKDFLDGFLGGAKGLNHLVFAWFVCVVCIFVTGLLGGDKIDALFAALAVLYSEIMRKK